MEEKDVNCFHTRRGRGRKEEEEGNMRRDNKREKEGRREVLEGDKGRPRMSAG